MFFDGSRWQSTPEEKAVAATLKPGQRIATRNGKPYAITVTNIGRASKSRPRKIPTDLPPPRPAAASPEELAIIEGLFYTMHRVAHRDDKAAIRTAIDHLIRTIESPWTAFDGQDGGAAS